MLSRTRRAHLRRSFAPEALESRTLLSTSTGSLAEALFTTSYASLQLRPALSTESHRRAERPHASHETTSFATQGLALVQQSTPPTFLQSLSVVSNADGTSAAIIDYQGTELGTYTASARWDDGPAEPVVVDQPGEFWHEPTVGSAYPLRRGLGAGQHTLELTVTNADRHVSATTSAAFSIESITPDEGTPAEPYGPDTAATEGSFAPSDGFTVDSGESLSAMQTDPAPQVAAVYVRAPGWTTDFKNYLATLSPPLGDTTYGYAIPAGTDQLKTLPWTGLDTISVRFTENVTVHAEDLLVKGVNFADYALKSDAFTYDDATFTATWRLQQAVANDKLLLHVTNFVTDSAGQRLDGEWTNGTTTNFPSGNGAADGVFDFQVNVYPGDVNFDGAVDDIDKADVRSRFFRSTTDTGAGTATPYTPFHDVDGSGMILASDYSSTGNRVGTTIPTTQPTSPTLPAAPGYLTATDLSSTEIVLFWEDQSFNESQFVIERRTGNGDGTFGNWSEKGSVGAGTTEYRDKEAEPRHSYEYRVRATGSAGSSGYSNVASASTNSTVGAPGILGPGMVKEGSPYSLILTNSAVDAAFTRWEIDWGEDNGAETMSGDPPIVTHRYARRGSYDITATAYSGDTAVGTVTDAVTVVAGPLKTPTDFSLSPVSSTSIRASWTDNSDNEDGFTVTLLYPQTVTRYTATVPANTTEYTFTDLIPSTAHSPVIPYQGSAFSFIGNVSSDESNLDVSETLSGAGPAAPTNLYAEYQGGRDVYIAWDAKWPPDVVGTQLELVPSEGETVTYVGNIAGRLETLQYPNMSYTARVRFFNESGYSQWTTTTFTTEGFDAPEIPSITDVHATSPYSAVIRWAPQALDDISYHLQLVKHVSDFQLHGFSDSEPGANSLSVSYLQPSTTYYAKVTADYGGIVRTSDVISFTTPGIDAPPAAPSGPVAAALSGESIAVVWGDMSDNETGFRLERSTDGVNFTNAGGGDGSFVDDNVSPGAQYFYRVIAYNENGESSSGTTQPVNTPSSSLPTVSVTAVDARAGESGPNPGRFIVRRRYGSLKRPLTVNYATDGSATPGEDYTRLSGSATIAANYYAQIVELTPHVDAVADPDESAGINLTSGRYALNFAAKKPSQVSRRSVIGTDERSHGWRDGRSGRGRCRRSGGWTTRCGRGSRRCWRSSTRRRGSAPTASTSARRWTA